MLKRILKLKINRKPMCLEGLTLGLAQVTKKQVMRRKKIKWGWGCD